MGKAKNRWLKTGDTTNVDAILERAEADRKASTRAAQAEERWPPSWSGGYYEGRPRSSAALAGRDDTSTPATLPTRSHKPHNPVTSSRERRAAAKKKSRTSNNQKPAGKKS